MSKLGEYFVFAGAHAPAQRRFMIVITEQMQNTVNDQALEFARQCGFESPGMPLRHRRANAQRSQPALLRRDAQIKRDDIGGRRIVEKLLMQRANGRFVDKMNFNLGGSSAVRPPKLLQQCRQPLLKNAAAFREPGAN